MKTPHKHAELIRAWADGYEIEFCDSCNNTWKSSISPGWSEHVKFRIKPEPKPDLVYYAAFGQVGNFNLHATVNQSSDGVIDTLKLAFCAETHKLKSVEILN